MLLLLVFLLGSAGLWAQTSQTLTQTVCVGNQPYLVTPIPGATFVWSITGGLPADYQINGTGDNITVDWNTPGVYVLSVYSYISLGCPSTTQSVTVTVVPQPTAPALQAMSPASPVCEGTDVSATFIAGTGGVGCADAFEYRYDGAGLWTAYTPGTNLSTTGHTLVEIQVQRSGCTADAGCTGTAWTTLATWVVNPILPVTVSIAADNNPVCDGVTVTYTATPTNGGAAPVYAWFVNGIEQLGETTATFAYTPLNADLVSATLTSNATCATGSPATSNTITMTVNSALPVSVLIAADNNPVCAGTSVTYTATPTNGGATPGYVWYLNGVPVPGETAATYTHIPINGDQVQVSLTSSTNCATGSPALSNTITMTVNPTLPVSVSIVADNNPVCTGTSVTFTATPINGGVTPAYAWYVNGILQPGETAATFAYTPLDTDQVSARLTSNATCATGNPADSNTITMTINIIPNTSPIFHN
jgi:hypothetical protein